MQHSLIPSSESNNLTNSKAYSLIFLGIDGTFSCVRAYENYIRCFYKFSLILGDS